MEIDFYAGAYGPTIRISCKLSSELERFLALLLLLATEEVDVVDFAQVENIARSNINQFLFRVIPSDTSGGKLYLTNKAEINFEWLQSPQGWIDTYETVNVLRDCRSGCHQYFAGDDSDDALIEVLYRD